MILDTDRNKCPEDIIKVLKSNGCHVVTFAEIGLSNFRTFCDFAYNISWDDIEKYADQVNKANETGSLYPKANITALPLHFFREPITNSIPGYSEDDLKICIRDAFIAERDHVKSGLMILEFTCSDISYELVYTICRDLCKTEFESVPGRAVLRHNHDTSYYPEKFVEDCGRLVGRTVSSYIKGDKPYQPYLKTEKSTDLVDAFKETLELEGSDGKMHFEEITNKPECDRFITYLWYVILFDQTLFFNYRKKLPILDGFVVPLFLDGEGPWTIRRNNTTGWGLDPDVLHVMVGVLVRACYQYGISIDDLIHRMNSDRDNPVHLDSYQEIVETIKRISKSS
jgi:hypothetical protein